MRTLFAIMLVLAFAAPAFSQPMTPAPWNADESWKQWTPYVVNIDEHCSRYQVARRNGFPDVVGEYNKMMAMGASEEARARYDKQVVQRFEIKMALAIVNCRDRWNSRQ